MYQRKFSPDEQRELRTNPYVERVSETTITYTVEFKKLFALEYATGKLPSVILRECGFDNKMLGRERQRSLVKRIKNYSRRPEGFSDTRKERSDRPRVRELSDSEKIQRLEHQVRYLKQENEFLKKIRLKDKHAEWEYNQKQNRKKSMHSSKE